MDFSIIGKQANDVEETPCRNRHGARSLDFRWASAANAYIEVRSGNVEPVLAGFQEYVGQDRDGALLFDHALNQIEFTQQIVSLDREFHESTPWN